MTYHLVQALTGHGCFGTYLERIGKTQNSDCLLCGAHTDDPEHAVFNCSAMRERKQQVESELKEELTPGTMTILMLEDPRAWKLIADYVDDTMQRREEEERRRQT